jgi:hypothetical protein
MKKFGADNHYLVHFFHILYTINVLYIDNIRSQISNSIVLNLTTNSYNLSPSSSRKSL